MGYTTDFDGQFDLDKPLTAAQVAYLKKFNEVRHMKRNARKLAVLTLPDPLREAVDLPLGNEGEYFVGGIRGYIGEENFKDDSVLDVNNPASSQPGLYCQWVPTDDGLHIEWDGGEKFYNYIEWLAYINAHFLKPWGIKINGEVTWQGEESSDRGMIVAKDGEISTKQGRIVYE